MAFLLEIVFGRLAHTFKENFRENFSCFSVGSYEVTPVAVAQGWLQGKGLCRGCGMARNDFDNPWIEF